MSESLTFEEEVRQSVKKLGAAYDLRKLAFKWLEEAAYLRYSYNFTALGRPIVQYPEDMIAIQELIWSVKPDLVIETGIAHGGSLVMSAAMLSLIDYCEAVEKGTVLDPKQARRKVLGVDVDIRPHNRAAIESHPMAHRIDMIQGSSIAGDTIAAVEAYASNFTRIMVILDSNHTHAHVLAELEAYAPLVARGSYCVVMDTAVEDMPDTMFSDRPWCKGDNPKTAVWAYIKSLKEEGRIAKDGSSLNLEIDSAIEHKIQITVAPDGYLKRI